MPPKVGEVLAAMHISLIQKIVRMFKGKPRKAVATTEVETHGMYIHKLLGNYVCSLTVPVVEVEKYNHHVMTVNVTDLTLGSLTETQLCFALNNMLRRNMHP